MDYGHTVHMDKGGIPKLRIAAYTMKNIITNTAYNLMLKYQHLST